MYFLFIILISILIILLFILVKKDYCLGIQCISTTYPIYQNDICSSDNTIDPKYCVSSKIFQNDCQDINTDDNCKTEKSQQCALELIIGENMHMTIAYICNCPINKNNFLNEIIEYIKNNWKKSTNINIILGNMMSGWFENNSRCILGDLAELKVFIMNYLNGKYCMTNGIWGKTPHTQVLFSDGCRKPYKNVNILDIKNWKFD